MKLRDETCDTGSPFQPRQRIHPKNFRINASQLLAVIVLMFLSSPLINDLPNGSLVEATILTFVMVFALLIIRGGWHKLVFAIPLVGVAMVGKWGNYFRPDLVHPSIFLIATVIFFAYVVKHLLRYILTAPEVDSDVLCAGIAGYLMLGLLWIPAYALVAHWTPGAFAGNFAPHEARSVQGFELFYYSFITLTTVGYGDIVPISKAAKMLALTEAIVGVFYIAVIISRLVAVYSSTESRHQTDRSESQEN